MGAHARSKGLRWTALAAAAVLLAVALLYFYFLRAGRPAASRQETLASPSSVPGENTPRGPLPSPGQATPSTSAAAQTASAMSEISPPAGAVYPVNFEQLRAEIPDNLYWRLGVPTRDPQIIQQRAEEEHKWNDLFGKVQSNTATEEEIRRYYDHRRRLSEDYIQFSSLVLQEFGHDLPDRDRGLYELSIQLHRKRLGEIPRQIEDALARKRAHDAERQEWLKGSGSH
jgi:hypothetical protein